MVAAALKEFLPLVLHYAKPWLSSRDISAGERWAAELGKELEAAQFGILCLTKENLGAPWLLFEAGALSKALTTSFVCPYLLDVDLSDLSGPLSQFQAKKSDKVSTFELIQAINGNATDPVDEQRLPKLFEGFWPEFETILNAIPSKQGNEKPVRTTEEILEELVSTVRSNDRRFADLDVELLGIREVLSSLASDIIPKLMRLPTPAQPTPQRPTPQSGIAPRPSGRVISSQQPASVPPSRSATAAPRRRARPIDDDEELPF